MILYLDSETHPIDRAQLAPRPVCVQTARDDGEPRIELWRDFDAREALQHTIVGANLAYDMAVFAAADLDLLPLIFDAYDDGRIVDTQLDARLLDIAAGEYGFRQTRGWNLQELARREGVRIDKDTDDETGDGSWRLRFGQLDGVPLSDWPDGAVRYALAEIPATRTVHLAQQAKRADYTDRSIDPLGDHSKHAAASAFALHLASCQGVLTNPRVVEHVAGRLETYLTRIAARLHRAGLVRASGKRDTKAAARAMIDACQRAGVPLQFTDGAEKKEDADRAKLAALEAEHADAQASGDGKACARIEKKAATLQANWHKGVHAPGVKADRDCAILSGSRVLEMYAEYTGASLVRGRVERMRQGYTLPLQTRFDPLKETARTSSKQPSPPLVGEQMQNFPRASGATPEEKKREREGEFFYGLRECFRPPDGYVFIVADLSMAELHAVAQLCITLFGRSKLAELLNAGVDVHWWLAAVTLSMSYDEIRAAGKTHKGARQRVKPGNFGFWGGMGAEKFVLYSRKGYGIRYTIPEAKRFKAQWRDAFPETEDYFAWVSRQMDRQGGRFLHVHPITGFLRGGCGYSDGANHGFQHLCAYGAKLGMYEVTKECYDPRSPLFGSRPWNFVHDEIPAIAPRERAPEAAHRLGEIMREQFNRFTPDVPTTAEPVICETWSKSAEPVHVDGTLVPWDPPPLPEG